MRRSEQTYSGVAELREHFASRRVVIRTRLDEFARVKPDEYFYELAYCLLTPQSSAVHATWVVDALRNADFLQHHLDPTSILRHKGHYIRFHNTKARYLIEAKQRFPEIMTRLSDDMPGPAARTWLVENVKGLGLKEASHFLRNIGRRDLAILDRHILKNLKYHHVVDSIPPTLTQKRYLAVERKFAAFAATIGITMDELDLLFWSRATGQILK